MKRFVVVLVILLLPASSVGAHSGRTDANGGHNCYVGACAGTYHYHNGGGSYTPPPDPEPVYTPPKPKPKPRPVTTVKPKTSQTSSTPTTAQDSSCFVATAAYGTPFSSDIQTLRDFRDNVLTDSLNGQLFVLGYYQVGPAAADFIEDKPLIRSVIREVILKPVVAVLDFTKALWG